MNGSRGWRIGRAIAAFWGVVAVLAVAGFAAAVHGAQVRARPALTIAHAMELLPDGSSRPVTLPQSGLDSGRKAATRRYEIDFTLPAAPTAPLLLHVPYYEQRLDVSIGGVQVFTSAAEHPWGGMFTHATALVLLPTDRLKAGRNSAVLTITSGPRPPYALSPVLIGTDGQLRSLYLVRSFLEDTLRPILFGLEAFLAFSGLVAFALRPGDAVFGWLGLMMTTTTFIGIGVISRTFPGIDALAAPAMLLTPAAGLSVLGFSFALSQRPRNRLVFGLILSVTAVLFVLVYGARIAPPVIAFGLAVPVAFFAIVAAMAVLLRLSWRAPRLEIVLFTLGLALLAAGVVHDYLMRAGVIGDGLFLAQFTRVITLFSIAIFLVRHQSEIADELDHSADVLRERLAAREAELAEVHDREKAREAARLLEEERARITANLHDGVAGHLTTIVALADRPDDVSGNIKTSARNALADLRLVIDALEVEDGELLFFLGQFRVRCIEPLEQLGTRVEWSMTGLPETGAIARERALNVLRILQEAVNNALRHGTGERLEIRGGPAGEGRVRIMVGNCCADEDKPDAEADNRCDSNGLGLASMRRRAQALGGSLRFHRADGQAELVLEFPV